MAPVPYCVLSTFWVIWITSEVIGRLPINASNTDLPVFIHLCQTEFIWLMLAKARLMSSDGAKSAGDQLWAKANPSTSNNVKWCVQDDRPQRLCLVPVRSDTTGKALTMTRGGETQRGISNFKGFCGAASHCKKRWKNKQASICKHWGTALVNNKGCTSDLIWNELFLGVVFQHNVTVNLSCCYFSHFTVVLSQKQATLVDES